MNSRLLNKLILMVFIFLPFSASAAISVGDTAPSFKARSIDGSNNVALEDYRGKVVLIDFWASWCPPCLKSFPPVGFPIVKDPKGVLPGVFGVKAMPTSYLIDQNGVVKYVHAAFKEGDIEKLKAEIEKLIAK